MHGIIGSSTLQACNQQQGIERLDQFIGLFDCLFEADPMGHSAAFVAQCRFGAVAQAREWRAQIMGDIVGNLAQGGHQFFDPAEHDVQIG